MIQNYTVTYLPPYGVSASDPPRVRVQAYTPDQALSKALPLLAAIVTPVPVGPGDVQVADATGKVMACKAQPTSLAGKPAGSPPQSAILS